MARDTIAIQIGKWFQDCASGARDTATLRSNNGVRPLAHFQLFVTVCPGVDGRKAIKWLLSRGTFSWIKPMKRASTSATVVLDVQYSAVVSGHLNCMYRCAGSASHVLLVDHLQ